MARIPNGEQFGNVLPEVQRAAKVPQGAFGVQIGVEVENFATGQLREMRAADERAQAEAQDQARREAHHAKEVADAADRVAANQALHEGHAQMRLAADDLGKQILRGEVDKDAAEAEWQRRSTELRNQHTERAPVAHRNTVAGSLDVNSLEMLRDVRKSVTQRGVSEVRAGIQTQLEFWEREAVRDREKAIKGISITLGNLGPAAEYTPDDITRLAFKSRENIAHNVLTAQVNAARDNIPELDRVLELVRKDEDLAPERRGALEHTVLARKQTVYNQQQVAVAHAEAAAARRDRVAERAVNRLQRFTDEGGVPDDKYMGELNRAVGGTEWARDVRDILEGASVRTGFALLPRDQQEAKILEQRQQAATNPQAAKRLQFMERIHTSTKKQLDDDALMYGSRLKLDIKPLQFKSLDELAPQLAERVKQAQTISAYHRGVPVSPLLDSEAEQASRMLAALPLTAKREAINGLAKVLDVQSITAMSAQFAKRDDTLARAMYAAKAIPGPSGSETVDLMLRGQDAVKAGRIKPEDKDSGASRDHAEIAKRLAEVPWPTTTSRDEAVRAARQVYDGIRDQKGSASVRDAITKSTGEITEWAGSKIVAPPGMEADTFKRALRQLDSTSLAHAAGGAEVRIGDQTLPLDKLAANLGVMKLRPGGGPGVYVIESGGQLVLRRDGKPMQLRIGGR